MTRSLHLAAACAALVCGGCAVIGGRFGHEIGQLKPGVTTQAQAASLLGPPVAAETRAGGETWVTWRRAEEQPGRRHVRKVVVVFAADGRMARVESRSNSFDIEDRRAHASVDIRKGS